MYNQNIRIDMTKKYLPTKKIEKLSKPSRSGAFIPRGTDKIPKELKGIIIDTSGALKKSSTKILENLRYDTRP